MNGDNDEGIRGRKLIHTSWRGMGPHQFAGIHRGKVSSTGIIEGLLGHP